MKINTTQVVDTMKQSKGRIFTVTFVKKNGDLRKMTCRLGVKKNLHGGHNNTAHISKYITVYDMVTYGYKNVNIKTVESLQVNGQVYTVV